MAGCGCLGAGYLAKFFAGSVRAVGGVDKPHPSEERSYEFERRVTFTHGDGSTSVGRIDLYRRGCFVLESKKIRGSVSDQKMDEALLRARSQAENYARALPAEEGRPPFVIVVASYVHGEHTKTRMSNGVIQSAGRVSLASSPRASHQPSLPWIRHFLHGARVRVYFCRT